MYANEIKEEFEIVGGTSSGQQLVSRTVGGYRIHGEDDIFAVDGDVTVEDIKRYRQEEIIKEAYELGPESFEFNDSFSDSKNRHKLKEVFMDMNKRDEKLDIRDDVAKSILLESNYEEIGGISHVYDVDHPLRSPIKHHLKRLAVEKKELNRIYSELQEIKVDLRESKSKDGNKPLMPKGMTKRELKTLQKINISDKDRTQSILDSKSNPSRGTKGSELDI